MALDPRLHAYRPNLADKRLEGQINADRFVEPTVDHVIAPVTRVHALPDGNSGMNTQFLHGDELRVFDRNNGWAWVQAVRDSYMGYIPVGDIDEGAVEPTHLVRAPRTFLYPEPDLKKP